MSDNETRSQDGFVPTRLEAGEPIVGDAVVTRADANGLTRVDAAAAPRTYTLPALAVTPIGTVFYLPKLGAGVNPLTITPVGADTVNGAASDAITTENAGAMIVAASATDWAALLIT